MPIRSSPGSAVAERVVLRRVMERHGLLGVVGHLAQSAGNAGRRGRSVCVDLDPRCDCSSTRPSRGTPGSSSSTSRTGTASRPGATRWGTGNAGGRSACRRRPGGSACRPQPGPVPPDRRLRRRGPDGLKRRPRPRRRDPGQSVTESRTRSRLSRKRSSSDHRALSTKLVAAASAR